MQKNERIVIHEGGTYEQGCCLFYTKTGLLFSWTRSFPDFVEHSNNYSKKGVGLYAWEL